MRVQKNVEYYSRSNGLFFLFKQWKKLLRDVFWGADIVIDGGTKTYPYIIAYIEYPKDDPYSLWRNKREIYYRRLFDEFSEHFMDSVVIVLVSEVDVDYE